ncbi:MAG: glycosyltransferase [Anaerolineaceae bacterium]|nr:glycosyltransferase [Anaerolineaceae bacterium]
MSSLASVIIPTFNRSALLREAVDSALAQNYRPLEVIVVDDGSTDDTAELMAAYGDGVRYIRQANAGVSAARNHGFSVSKGAFVAFLDDDDRYLPQKIERQVAYIQAHPAVGLVHSRYLLGNAAGQVVGRMGLLSEGDVLKELLHRNFLWMSAPLIRRDVLEKVGGFDEALSTAADYDLWLRIADAGYPFGCVQEPLGIYRLQHGSMVTNVARTEAEVITILDRYFAQSGHPPELLTLRDEAYTEWRLWFVRRHYAVGNWDAARRNLSQALSLNLGITPATLLDTFYSEAIDERVRDPFAYVADVFEHLPPEAEFLHPFRPTLLNRIHLAVALRGYQRPDVAGAREYFAETLRSHPELAAMKADFVQIATGSALGLPVEADQYINTVFANLPPAAGELAQLEARVRSDVAVARAFEDYHNNTRAAAAALILSALRARPAWIRNRGVASMLVKSLPAWFRQAVLPWRRNSAQS